MSKKESNRRRHEFLLTLFPDQNEEYSELPMNGFILVRQFNGGSNEWEVAIYTEESFKNKQEYLEGDIAALL